jgi:hypothetical protein
LDLFGVKEVRVIKCHKEHEIYKSVYQAVFTFVKCVLSVVMVKV